MGANVNDTQVIADFDTGSQEIRYYLRVHREIPSIDDVSPAFDNQGYRTLLNASIQNYDYFCEAGERVLGDWFKTRNNLHHGWFEVCRVLASNPKPTSTSDLKSTISI